MQRTSKSGDQKTFHNKFCDGVRDWVKLTGFGLHARII
jgi:hypothetical protein